MSGLVGYGSSDEDEDDIQTERPSKIAKTGSHDVPATVTAAIDRSRVQQSPTHDLSAGQDIKAPIETVSETIPEPVAQPTVLSGPAAGPSAQPEPAEPSTANTPSSPPLSPYSFERQRLRDLTMPTVPNFSIPDSPPPPPSTSEEAAALAATTKKFTRFLELKKQGVHFNERLQNTPSLRNPSLLPKLMDFAGIHTEESYASTLSVEAGAVPTRWPEECSVENLVKTNERREKKRMAERDKVEFVSATASSKSGASSAAGTPKSGSEHRKSRFDKR